MGTCLTATIPLQASAAGGGDGCNPSRSDNFLNFYFVGDIRTLSTTSGGVYADILNYSPWVSPSDYSESEWVMLINKSDTQYAQVGWQEQPYGKRYTFTEIGTDNGPFVDGYYSPQPINSVPNYRVDYNPNPQTQDEYFTYYVNNVLIDQSSYLFTPYGGEIQNEMHTSADQWAGGYDNGNYMDTAHIYYPAGSGAWYNFDGVFNSINAGPSGTGTANGPSWSDADYTRGSINNNSFTTWDAACPY